MPALRLLSISLVLSLIALAQDVQRDDRLEQPSDQNLAAQVIEQGSVPKLVKFSGTLRDEGGQPIVGSATLTFSVYRSNDDASPLWSETRVVRTDNEGKYSVLLGATKADGIDTNVFASHAGRYIGVRIDGRPELARAALVSVPYALKAGDAEMLGGLTAGDFVLTRSAREKLIRAGVQNSGTQAALETFGAVVSGANSTGKIAKFTATDTVGDSVMTESGGNVGIGTAAPAEQLELTGNLRTVASTATTGIWYQGPNRFVHTAPFGSGNLFVGVNAGTLTTTSTNNLGVGNAALGAVTSGSNNMALGGQAMANLTTGVQNTAVGAQSLFNNQANNNTGVGFNALVATTTGGGNTAVGTQAGQSISSGTFNTAIGYNADVSTGTLTNATAIGANSRVNVSNAVILGNGANVGLGTSSPSFTAGGGMHIFNSSVAALKLASSGSSFEMFSINNGNFGLYDTMGAAYRLYITPSGNVGIGTTTPTNKLEVAGTVKSTTGGFVFPDGSTQTTAVTGTVGDITSVTAGTGLTGGGSTGAVSLAVDTAVIQARVTGTCSTGNYVMSIGSNGSVVCGVDQVGTGGSGPPTTPFSITGSNNTGIITGVQTNSTLTQPAFPSSFPPAGLVGNATATSNFEAGVLGTAASPTGFGVLGVNTSTVGVESGQGPVGVIGVVQANHAVGVLGSNDATSGVAYGVQGNTRSTSGTGVSGEADAMTGATVGVQGIVQSSSGTAGLFMASGPGAYVLRGSQIGGGDIFAVDASGNVRANNYLDLMGNSALASLNGTNSFNGTNTFNQNTQMNGGISILRNDSLTGAAFTQNGSGVALSISAGNALGTGIAITGSGTGINVNSSNINGSVFSSSAASGAAVNATSNGGGTGVIGTSNGSTNGATGLLGQSTTTGAASGGFVYGVRGTTSNNTNLSTGVGVKGEAQGSTSGAHYGVWGTNAGTQGAGVRGDADSTSGTTANGVFGRVGGAGNGISGLTLANSTTGNAVFGQVLNSSSTGSAISGLTAGTGAAAKFETTNAGGKLISGIGSSASEVFAVNASGLITSPSVQGTSIAADKLTLAAVTFSGLEAKISSSFGLLDNSSSSTNVGWHEVQLLNGDSITALRVCGRDFDTSGEISATLYRKPTGVLNNSNVLGNLEQLATVSSGTSASADNFNCFSTSSITNGTIDNSNYVYLVKLSMSFFVQATAVQVDH